MDKLTADQLVFAYKAVIADFSQAAGWETDFQERMVASLTTRLYELEVIWPFFNLVETIEDEMPSGEVLDGDD